MLAKVTLNILSPVGFTHKEEAKAFLQFLLTSYPEYAPEKFNYVEPVRYKFYPNDIDDALSGFDDSFLWTRKTSKVNGSIWPACRPDHHGWFVMRLEVDEFNHSRTVQFIKDASSFLTADFAFMHALHPTEIAQTMRNDTIGCNNPEEQEYGIDITTFQLKKYVPNLYWATIFGRPYVNLVGRHAMLESPASIVEELSYGGICIQLSHNISDVLTEYDKLDAVRVAVKHHINRGLFWLPEAPEDHSYTVPDFHLGER
jgi:hypothetical protein